MIFGNLAHLAELSFLPENIKKCFAYWQEHALQSYEKGSYEIDGDRLFVNVVEYETTAPENRFWEAHREYLDVHVMLQGQEQIDLNFLHDMQTQEYVPAEDFVPMTGEKNGSVILRPGDFLICDPNDGHRTAVAVGAPETIKKAIFKVKI